MDFSISQTDIGFAIIALGVAGAYLSSVWLLMSIGRLVMRLRKPASASCRPGEMLHQALRVSGRLWDHYRTAALLFGVSFLLLVNFGRDFGFGLQPAWLNTSVLCGVLGVLGFSILKMVQLMRYRARLQASLELHQQVARRLVEVQLRGNRVFPSVGSGDDAIDYVVVSQNGVYALHLASLPKGVESVQLERGGLICQPGGTRVELQQFNNAVLRLGSSLSAQTGSPVSMLPVIIAAGGRIMSEKEPAVEPGQNNDEMLVSLQACASFIGWQKEEFFLHDDDIARLNGWLGEQMLKQPPRTLATAVSSLERQIKWPALVGYQR
ncbi:MAG: hypothetical protein WBN31_15185 [Gammaproteobacteria bacterium]